MDTETGEIEHSVNLRIPRWSFSCGIFTLMGDSELAVLLMALGGYKEEMDEIITANSVIMQTMRENSEILEKTTGNADCT